MACETSAGASTPALEFTTHTKTGKAQGGKRVLEMQDEHFVRDLLLPSRDDLHRWGPATERSDYPGHSPHLE